MSFFSNFPLRTDMRQPHRALLWLILSVYRSSIMDCVVGFLYRVLHLLLMEKQHQAEKVKRKEAIVTYHFSFGSQILICYFNITNNQLNLKLVYIQQFKEDNSYTTWKHSTSCKVTTLLTVLTNTNKEVSSVFQLRLKMLVDWIWGLAVS